MNPALTDEHKQLATAIHSLDMVDLVLLLNGDAMLALRVKMALARTMRQEAARKPAA